MIALLEDQSAQLQKQIDLAASLRIQSDSASAELRTEQARAVSLRHESASLSSTLSSLQNDVDQCYSALSNFRATLPACEKEYVAKLERWKSEHKTARYAEIQKTRELRNGIKARLNITISSHWDDRDDEKERSLASREADNAAKQELSKFHKAKSNREAELSSAHLVAKSRLSFAQARISEIERIVVELDRNIESLRIRADQQLAQIASASREVDRLPKVLMSFAR